MSSDVLTVAQLADLLDCTAEIVLEAARTGRLPHVRYGRGPVFPKEALLQHLNRQATQERGLRPQPTGVDYRSMRAV